MTDLTKDEVVKMAIKAGLDQEFWLAESHPNYDNEMRMLTTFAALCRAPLVAENAALNADMKQMGADLSAIQEIHNQQKAKLYADRDDWKARAEAAEAELARVRAGEPFAWARPDAVDASQDFRFIEIDDFTVPLYATPPQPAAQEQTSAVPVVRQMVEALERKLPGGKQTDDFESSRIGDYNQGWNDYRKAVKKMFKNINMNSSENSNPDAYLYSLEYGEKVVDTKVSIHQLNYPFGVAGADYLVRNDDGVSYVRQTKLYAALSRALAAGQKFIKENGK